MSKAFVTITVILLIIGILLFILVGKIAANIFKIGFRTQDSFTTLIAKIENINEGSQDPINFFLDADKNSVLGFAPSANRLELVSKERDSQELILTHIKRPASCPKDKSCVCFCAEILLGDKIKEESKCVAAIDCRSLDRVTITDYTYISERKIDQINPMSPVELHTTITRKDLIETYFWRNGFAIIRSSTMPPHFNNIPNMQINQNIKTVYVKKDFGKVVVCISGDCNVAQPGFNWYVE